MYHFSRSIYRELASDILEDRPEHEGPTNHERVLHSCEVCVERLATDWHYFARPTKTLFNDIRIYFPMSAQLKVYRTVDRYMSFAREYFVNNPIARAPRVPRDHSPGHAVPADTAAAQRLLPVAPAPRRDRRGPARSLSASVHAPHRPWAQANTLTLRSR